MALYAATPGNPRQFGISGFPYFGNLEEMIDLAKRSLTIEATEKSTFHV